ncbi:MAG: hypothetical protein LBM08_07770 [Dysgonamonadaceae bacterium]|jgi:hypothetical protein|nr:hypothetical protein [Dysgonamonadaceae bacterium]
MASKKDLKQRINEIAGELFTECLFCKLYIPEVDNARVDRLIANILDMQVEFLNRANRPDAVANRKLVKASYRKLKESLAKKVDELCDEIVHLNQQKEI